MELSPSSTTSAASTLPIRKPSWTAESAEAVAVEACARIAPLWPLRHFVAVNPFLGLTGKTFADTCEAIARIAPGGMQMDLGFYREKLAAGEIQAADLEAALGRAAALEPRLPAELRETLDAESLRDWLLAESDAEEAIDPLPTFSETHDRLHGTRWSTALEKTVTDFCAAWLDEGQSAWRIPWNDGSLTLFSAWKEYAAIDRQLDCLGIAGFREAVAALPDSPEEALALSLENLGIDPAVAPVWLHRVLLTIRGWAGALQYQSREKVLRGGEDDGRLFELLAIRVAGEAVLHDLVAAGQPGLAEHWPPMFDATEEEATGNGSRLSRPVVLAWLAQLAHEHAWERKMKAALATTAGAPDGNANAATEPADVQAVFCIDVRSEVFRRALESVSPGIHTSGFAGFFGLPIEYRPLGREHGQAQCPVLLVPGHAVPERHHDAECDAAARKKLGLTGRLSHGWNAFKTSAISCFSFVETAGLLFGGSLVRDGFAGRKAKPSPADEPGCGPSIDGIAPDDRVALAHGMLKNLGLTGDFARLVLLCGHGSETVNNPYGSGLDCGACGGHAGDANARVGAALLNDPEVRARLTAEHGIDVPETTWFLAGLHNTTTDDVTLFDLETVPASHAGDVAGLRENLAVAGKRSRIERSALLGLSPDEADLDDEVRSRARDWSQVRPEWGLAGNAAFVAAPRSRTRQANLGGRVFLHDYDHHADPDNSILELIMTAPMVVANWINLQYFGSTVNNEVFGSGNKVLHNVVGTLGVCLGNNGDLQTGLPLQSVHDGTRYIHEPIRLHVFLEAPRDRIDAVLAAHDAVRELVDHQWLHVFALAEDGTAARRLPGGGWE